MDIGKINFSSIVGFNSNKENNNNKNKKQKKKNIKEKNDTHEYVEDDFRGKNFDIKI